MPLTKRCYRCKRTRRRSNFWRDESRADGLFAACKDCHRARMQPYWRDYYPAHKPELIAAVQRRRATTPTEKGA